MVVEIGHVEAISRYPVKSMRDERLEFAARNKRSLPPDSSRRVVNAVRPN
jgi:hypothetical protein